MSETLPHLRSEMLVMAKLIQANEQYLSSRLSRKAHYLLAMLTTFMTVPVTVFVLAQPSMLLGALWSVMALFTLVFWVVYAVSSHRTHALELKKIKAQKTLDHLITHHSEHTTQH